MDSYLTLRIGSEAIGELEDRRSRFIASLVHISSEVEAQEHQVSIRSRHYDARHHVPAWILADGRERASDDGEPQRSSGLPSLEVLRGAGLKDVSCVTARYFGGTLLGTGGLVRAYSGAAKAAIERAYSQGLVVEMTSVVPVDIHLAYPEYQRVLDLAERCGAHVASTDFTDAVDLRLVFKQGAEDAFLSSLREMMGGREDVSTGSPRFAEF